MTATHPTPHPEVLGIVQARVSSSRLPAKVLSPILGRPMLARQIERLRRCKNISRLIVATSADPSDDAIAKLCESEQVECFRGSLDDVLDRFYQAARAAAPAHVARMTGDCPLADPQLIDRVIDFHIAGNYDLVSNAAEPFFPDGLDVAVFRFRLLEQAWREARLPSEREHVTLYMRQHAGRNIIGAYRDKDAPDRSHLRWTVDEPADLEFVRKIYGKLYPDKHDFSSEDVYRLLEQEPGLLSINSGIARNQGLQRSLVQDIEWKKRNDNENS